jgi:serine/threonine protein kinase
MDTNETRRLLEESPETRRISQDESVPIKKTNHYIDSVIKEKYAITEKITDSGEGTIFKGIDNLTGLPIVIKIYNRDNHGVRIEPDLKIVEKLAKLDHPNILKILDFDRTSTFDEFFELSPFAKDGNLTDIVKKSPMSIEDIKVILTQISSGLNFLHDNDIIHRDMKPENILILNKDKLAVAITDYGLSSMLNHSETIRQSTRRGFTTGYAAPEARESIVSKEGDYYSLGIILLYLVLGHDPFIGLSNVVIATMTYSNKIEIPESIPDELKKLILGLTYSDRKKRFGYKEIQDFLQGKELVLLKPIESESASDELNIPLRNGFKFYEGETSRIKTLKQLSEFMWKDRKLAIKHIKRNNIDQLLRNNSSLHERYIDISNDINDVVEIENDEDLLFLKVMKIIDGKVKFMGKVETIEELVSYAIKNRDEFKKLIFS